MSIPIYTQSRIRVLHLEDDADHAEIVRYHLALAKVPFEYDCVTTRDDYTTALRRGRYDLILADFCVPEFDGLEAYRLARQSDSDIPFILISSRVEAESLDRCFSQGVTNYLSKENLKRLGPLVRQAAHQSQQRCEQRRIQEEWAQFIDLSQDCFCVITPEGYFKHLSPSWERLTGFSEEALQSTPFTQFIHVEERAMVDQEVHGLTRTADVPVRSPTHCTFEARFACKDAAWRWLQWNAAASADGSLIYATARDITEKKELHMKFLRAQRLDSLGSIASGIAHDLNNIFTPILLASGVLDGMLSDPRQKHLLSTVNASAQRGADLVRQILLFTRGRADTAAPANSQSLNPEPSTAVKPVIDELANMLNETFPKTIRIETKVVGDLLPVRVHPTEVHQILLNLCVNARDAMPNGGLLRIEAANVERTDASALKSQISNLESPQPYVRLSVADTGSGIPPEVLGKIFDQFFTTKVAGEGTGLGLHTVQKIVQEHQGFIDVKSQCVGNKGTQFTIDLPAAGDLVAADISPRLSPPADDARSNDTPAAESRTILIVDDEHAILEIAEMLLKRAGYRVVTASGGPQALATFAEKKDIALVIIDMIMPMLDGPATIRAFQNLHPETPVVGMSGLSENEKLLDGLKNTGFLLKPFNPDQLLDIVAKSLRKPA